jgi:NADPH:quinone reductase-like Zn-dependent oxidoreductase
MASTQIPSTQKAWRVVRRGSPADAVILEADVPVPSDIKEGEVLVKVEAAALNPV